MNNVVLHKIVKFIFTENQLKGYWKKLGEDLDYSSLTNEQIISLAKKMFENASHSQLEQHIAEGVWRTKEEETGKLLAEDDSQEDVHIELVDTSQIPGSTQKVIIDRFLKMDCPSCSFTFYIQNLDTDPTTLCCPKCKSNVN